MVKAPAKKAAKKVATKKKVVKKPEAKKAVAKKVIPKKPPKKIVTKKAVRKPVAKKVLQKKVVAKKTAIKNPSKKIVIKAALKKPLKVPIKKTTAIDYFKLPFEVHYGECVSVTMYEFKSDIETNRFADVKAVHIEQGRSWGTEFSCDENKGPELYCCLTNSHDEVAPSWLSFQEESEISFNYGCDYTVQIEGNEIKFVSLTNEQQDEDSEHYLNVGEMDYCCSSALYAYEIGQSSPDYIILDAKNSRIKIDLDGYELDDEDIRIESQRIIDTDELDLDDYSDFESSELWDAKFEWVKSILEKDFPKDTNLSLAWQTK